ncbi:MAG: PUA domain-containing protein, partial [Candidatus Humimicrobiaceae bacterium]
TKIRSAKICSFSGIPMAIANSRQPRVIQRILEGESLGTFFIPEETKRITGMKRWIAFGMVTKGSIKIDKGAEEAIVNKGKSLLPVGVIEVEGCFKKGDNIMIVSTDTGIIAKGISNLASENISMIKGKNEKEILDMFGPDLCCEVIHRDSLVVF